MKRNIAMLIALTLVCLLAACGDKAAETKDVDLEEFYAAAAEEYEWGENYMADIEGELLDSYYPGLGEIPTKQFVAKMPVMSSVVNEMVLMECENETDAEKAAAILRDRIDVQAEGGAWYPESMEAWSKAIVIQQGNYVGLIASAEHQDEIAEGFNNKFL